MNAALVQFHCDEELKERVTELYENLGLDLPSAFRLFMKRSLQVRGLPFPVSEYGGGPKTLDEMTEREFSVMVERGYEQSVKNEGRPVEEVFASLEHKYGL